MASSTESTKRERLDRRRTVVKEHSLPYLESVERAVVLDHEVLEFVDGEVVSELAEEIGQVHCLHCKRKHTSSSH